MTQTDAIHKIARVVHESLRAWAIANGQVAYPPWMRAPRWMKDSTIKSVLFALNNPDAPASAQHEQWMAQKRADGWVFGPVKDPEKKTHPLLIAYAQLPEVERKKDALLNAVVRALAVQDTPG